MAFGVPYQPGYMPNYYPMGQLAYYNPRPVPAFPVPAPYQYGNCGTCNC